MRPQRFTETLRFFCVLVLAFAVAAGPCQACFDAPVKSPAHNCCPSQKNAPQHQHNSSCSDVQVAIEQSKATLSVSVAEAMPVVALPMMLLPVPAFDRLEASLSASHTPFLITLLRI
ncbi:MAG: hypothetical protein ABI972_11955 [Acidobacteriota bacterium]